MRAALHRGSIRGSSASEHPSEAAHAAHAVQGGMERRRSSGESGRSWMNDDFGDYDEEAEQERKLRQESQAPELETPSLARSYIIAAMKQASLYQIVFLVIGLVLMIVQVRCNACLTFNASVARHCSFRTDRCCRNTLAGCRAPAPKCLQSAPVCYHYS